MDRARINWLDEGLGLDGACSASRRATDEELREMLEALRAMLPVVKAVQEWTQSPPVAARLRHGRASGAEVDLSKAARVYRTWMTG